MNDTQLKSNSKSVRIRPLDVVFCIVSVAAIVFSFVWARKGGGSKPMLVIDSPGGQYVYALDTDATYEVEGRLGISTIRVSGGRAFFTDSPCPNKTCVQSSPVSQNGEWSACLPNDIFIRVENTSDDSVDAVAF